MNKKAHLAGIGFSTIFGVSFLFSKMALIHIDPMALLAYRFLFAGVTFFILRLTHVITFKFEKRMLKICYHMQKRKDGK